MMNNFTSNKPDPDRIASALSQIFSDRYGREIKITLREDKNYESENKIKAS